MTFKRFVLLASIGGFFAALLASFAFGGYELSPAKLLALASGDDGALSAMDKVVFYNIRSPRVLAAIFVGAALAVAGAVYQGCFANPIVEPYILGASAGAAFGAALGIVYPSVFGSVWLGAFVCASAAVGLSCALAGSKRVALILCGVVVSSLFMALVAILKYTSDDGALREITFWMMGGLYYASWADVRALGVVSIAGCALLWALGRRLDVISLGDEQARTLGISPGAHKAAFIALSTLLSATCVSHVGIIAWIGLMIPHAARMLLGCANRGVIALSALLGASYLLVCDLLARVLIAGEIPLGVVSSVLGAPFLLLLIRKRATL